VRAEDGKIVSNFETAATPVEGQSGVAYHLSFPLGEGLYTVEIAGAAAGELQMTRSLEAEISAVPDDGTWMSPICLGAAASLNREAHLGDAFTFAVWHLTPISGPELMRTSEIAYFGFIVRPVLNEEGAVELTAQVRLKRNGKLLGNPLVMPLESPQISGDLYVYGNFLGLTGVPEPGSYDLEFEITENNSETSTKRSVSIEITE
jgi:hypothetical protein